MIADCKLYIALLTIVRQDIPAIIKTGMFELRRAWKIYTTIQKRLFELFKQIEPNAEQIYGTDPNKLSEIDMINNNNESVQLDGQFQADAMNNADDDLCIIDQSTVVDVQDTKQMGTALKIKQLLASVSFGYGIMQLCFSFLPPSIMKLLKFIGKYGKMMDE
jgi:hypothetical protein